MTEYHGKKKAGDFTHYGDQCMWLLESIALEDDFSLDSFSKRWREYMSTYEGYIDGASKASLQNLLAGKSALESGSSSQDLSVVGRMAPLALLYYDKQIDNLPLPQRDMMPETIEEKSKLLRLRQQNTRRLSNIWSSLVYKHM